MFANLTPQQRDVLKAGAILAIVLVAGSLYYRYQFVTPQIARYIEQKTKLDTEKKQIDAQIREIKVAMSDVEGLKRKQELLASISNKLPNAPDAPGFYQALVGILQLTRVSSSELTQQESQVRTSYTEIPYKIVCRGRYHDIGNFLNLIEENGQRFMRVKTFTIDNQEMRPSIHPASVEIGTFMFNSRG